MIAWKSQVQSQLQTVFPFLFDRKQKDFISHQAWVQNQVGDPPEKLKLEE